MSNLVKKTREMYKNKQGINNLIHVQITHCGPQIPMSRVTEQRKGMPVTSSIANIIT